GDRYCKRRIGTESGHDTGNRLIDLISIGSPNDGLAGMKWIPGKTEAWLKIFVVLVVGIVDRNKFAGGEIKVNETVFGFIRSLVPRVAQAKFQSQRRREFVAVLREELQGILRDPAGNAVQGAGGC